MLPNSSRWKKIYLGKLLTVQTGPPMRKGFMIIPHSNGEEFQLFFLLLYFSKNMQEGWNFMLPVKIIRAYFSFYTDGTE